jgi:hypothetical protein
MLLEQTWMPRADMSLQVKGKCLFSCPVESGTLIGLTTFFCHTNSADYGQRIQDSLEQLKHAVKAIRSLVSAVGEADVRSSAVRVPESAKASSHVIANDGHKDAVRAIMPEAATLISHSEITMQQPKQPNKREDLSRTRSLNALSVSLRHSDMFVRSH